MPQAEDVGQVSDDLYQRIVESVIGDMILRLEGETVTAYHEWLDEPRRVLTLTEMAAKFIEGKLPGNREDMLKLAVRLGDIAIEIRRAASEMKSGPEGPPSIEPADPA